jgi:hypothetical protein
MGYPVPKPPPPPPWYREEESDPSWSRGEKEEATREDEWNAKQDRVSYFWQVIAAIVIAASLVALLL